MSKSFFCLDILKRAKKFFAIRHKTAALINLIIFIFLISISCLTVWAVDYFKSPGLLSETKTIIIKDGSSLKSISEQLAQNNIIEFPKIFTLIVRLSESGSRMKAGEYEFQKHISPLQVFGKIASGNVVTHNVTVPEGLTTVQILEIISNAEFLTGEVPSDVLEGELLPETYGYHLGDSRKKIVNHMKAAMKKVLDEEWEKRADGLPIKNKKEAVILASIVEKETGISAERERVAAVFINRLRKKMRLQTDPTVIYAITQGKYVLERKLRFKDLEIDSPFNTYKNYGLPPSPIANPGKASIIAVLNPAKTDEYYFVADGTGGHTFSSTLEVHNSNVRKWRKINRKKR